MTRTETETAIVIEVDHGIVDENGRAIGGSIRIETTPTREYRVDDTGSPTGDVRGYAMYTSPTRSGHRFGVSSNVTYHASIADAEAFGQRQLAAQAKRYRKRFGVP